MTNKTVWEVVVTTDNHYALQAHHGDQYDERLNLTGNFPDGLAELLCAVNICKQLNGGIDVDAPRIFLEKVKVAREIDSVVNILKQIQQNIL